MLSELLSPSPAVDAVTPVAAVTGTPTELMLARACGWLDRAVLRLLAGRWWFLRVGLAAVVASLLMHTPNPAAYDWFAGQDRGRILARQVEHPLTPLPLHKKLPGEPLTDVDDAMHLEKVSFRLTVPILGKLSGTGAAAWTVFSCLGGLIFFPLFAWAAARWTSDRLTAAYLTLACAATYVGADFFNDNFYGDGLAWTLLLAAVAVSNPVVVFAAVFAASFTDERALMASSGVMLFWLIQPASGPGHAPEAVPARWQRLAVLAAWAAYFAVRFAVSECFGLKTGLGQMFIKKPFGEHVLLHLPYDAVDVFKGLWLWFGLGLAGLLLARRWWPSAAYAAIGAGLTATALLVYDLQRSLGYLLVLLPVALCWHGLSAVNHRWLARVVCVANFVVLTPWFTPFRYVFQIIWGIRVNEIHIR